MGVSQFKGHYKFNLTLLCGNSVFCDLVQQHLAVWSVTSAEMF